MAQTASHLATPHPEEISKLMSGEEGQTRLEKAREVTGKVAQWTSDPSEHLPRMLTFSGAEIGNREQTFAIAYYKKMQELQKAHPELSKEQMQQETIDYGVKMVDTIHFLYNAMNRPKMYRNPLGRLLFQFKIFTTNMVSYHAKLLQEADPRWGGDPQELQKVAWVGGLWAIAMGLETAFSTNFMRFVEMPEYEYLSQAHDFFFGDDETRKRARDPVTGILGPTSGFAWDTIMHLAMGKELGWKYFENQVQVLGMAKDLVGSVRNEKWYQWIGNLALKYVGVYRSRPKLREWLTRDEAVW